MCFFQIFLPSWTEVTSGKSYSHSFNSFPPNQALTSYRNAKIAGMEEDLNINGNMYPWLLTIFYIAYVLFEPLALMWKLMPPHRWAAITALTW